MIDYAKLREALTSGQKRVTDDVLYLSVEDQKTVLALLDDLETLKRERDEARDTIATASAIVAKHAWRSPELDNLSECLAAALSDANADDQTKEPRQ